MYYSYHSYSDFLGPLPEGWTFHEGEKLKYKEEIILHVRKYGVDKAYIVVLNPLPCTPEDNWFYYNEDIYEGERTDYYLSVLLGKELPATVFPNVPTPHVWREFLSIKSNNKKRSWLYKATRKRGLAVKAMDTGNWVVRSITRRATVDGVSGYWEETHKLRDNTLYCNYRGAYYTIGDHNYVHEGIAYPFEVFIQKFSYCEEHGIYEGRECPLCAVQYEVRPYQTKAENIFPFKDDGEKNPVYLGIELEYEDCLRQNKAVIDALKNHAILKRDGSILHGFEIVTAPATLAVHKKAFEGFYSKAKLVVKSNCGFHVHVDKRKMGEMQIGKLLSFIYAKENIPWIEDLAGRKFSTNSYCKADIERGVTDGVYSRHNFYEKHFRRDNGKYEALNLAPIHTVEFRIFAPPLDEKTLYQRLEFVQALVDWTKPGVCGVKEAKDKEKFKSFVRTYRKFYPNLYEVCK